MLGDVSKERGLGGGQTKNWDRRLLLGALNEKRSRLSLRGGRVTEEWADGSDGRKRKSPTREVGY